jgi:hypothetical protein
MTFDGTCERGGFQRAPQEIEKTPPGTSTEAQKQGIRSKLEIGNLGKTPAVTCWHLGTGERPSGHRRLLNYCAPLVPCGSPLDWAAFAASSKNAGTAAASPR